MLAAFASLSFGALTACNNGYDEYDMVDPPKPNSTDTEVFPGWFVKEDGTGEGSSWDDAMSPSKFRDLLESGVSNGTEFFLAGGTYLVGSDATEYLNITTGVVIHGGFDPASTGYSTEVTYPSQYETIISGDINSDGEANEGDAHLMEVTTKVPAEFYGITFKNGFISATTHTERSGITVLEGGAINLNYCTIENCVSTISSPTGSAGGAALYVAYGDVKMNCCVIQGNTSDNRGGAIRMANVVGYVSTLRMNRCLIADNGISGDFGGAIQVSGADCKIYMDNCTLTGNYANYGGAGINTPSPLVMANCTLVNNLCKDGSQGHEIRCESADLMHLTNSIFVEEAGHGGYSVCANLASHIINSNGYNIFSTVGGGGAVNLVSTDKTGIYSQSLFSSVKLADNNGYPQTLALKNSHFDQATLESLMSFASAYVLPYAVNVDQRGASRISSVVSPGAYEYNGQFGDADSGEEGSFTGEIPDMNPETGK